MTRAQAATELRALLGDGDAGPLGEALSVAIRALEPARKRAASAKVSPCLAGFLRLRFRNLAESDRLYREAMGAEDRSRYSPAALAQFADNARKAARMR